MAMTMTMTMPRTVTTIIITIKIIIMPLTRDRDVLYTSMMKEAHNFAEELSTSFCLWSTLNHRAVL